MIMRAIEGLMAIAACSTFKNVMGKNFPAVLFRRD
jgi:hypothetical protein